MSKLKIEFLKWIAELNEYRIGYKIKRLKRKADKYREVYGSQMFVLKYEGRIRTISKRWFKRQRQIGKFPKSMTSDDLKKISYYYTRG